MEGVKSISEKLQSMSFTGRSAAAPDIFGIEQYRNLVRTYEILSSRWLVVAFLMLIVIAAAAWGLLAYLGDYQPTLEGFSILITSVAAGVLLALTYGWTHYFTRRVKSSPQQVAQAPNEYMRVADACEMHLLKQLVMHVYRYTQEELQALLQVALEDVFVRGMLLRLQISREECMQAIASIVLPKVTWNSLPKLLVDHAIAHDRPSIGVIDIVGGMLLDPDMRTFLRQHDLQEQDISFVLSWAYQVKDARFKHRRWWDPDNLLDFMGIGLSWASGYTPFIDRFTRIPRGNLWDTPYGHQDQVDQLITDLARQRQSNVLVVGQPGVGRLGIIKELSRRVLRGTAHKELNGMRVVYINLSQLVSMASSGSQQLQMATRALSEMERSGNIIVVLDGIAGILGGRTGVAVDLTELILPFLSSQTVRVVTIMSTDEYHERIRNNAELMHLFEVVHVPPLDEKATLGLLAVTVPSIEGKANVFVPYYTLKELVKIASTILPNIPFPEKAFDILEEVIVAVQQDGEQYVLPKDVHAIISRKIGVNLGEIEEGEREHLLNLEEILHQRVVDQEQGITAIAHAMVRARAGVRNENRPIGVFLFLGPTGVGKTETAKALAHVYFGSEDLMERLDMSEFQSSDGVALLIGDEYNPTGRLTNLISDHPYAVLLLDEFEKASRLVQQIFLPVFDEGYLTDARGRTYAFTHTIIIATSNAGAEYIRKSVRRDGSLPDQFDKQLREHVLQQGIFLPEVLNRFDGVITYKPLTPAYITQIAVLMLEKLNRRLDAEHGATVAVTKELVQFLVQHGYDPEFGARPMARMIQNTVEFAVAEKILKAEVEPGQQVVLDPQNLVALAQAV